MKLYLILIIMISLFSSCNKQNQKVPEWAKFFEKEDYHYFIDIVRKYFKEKDYNISINDGVLIIEDKDFNGKHIGLVNLAQVCNKANKNAWVEIVNDHFNNIFETVQFESDFNDIKHDFEQIKKYLGVRLFHVEYVEAIGKENAIFKQITDDIIELLVFDLPDVVINVKPENATNWDKSIDELFAIGFDNIKSNYPLEISQQDMMDFNIWLVLSNHNFATNIILDKTELEKYIGAKGALIGIPHRHAVLIYPINDINVINALNSMIIVIKGMYEEGPGSISDNIYWYNNREMIELPYEIADTTLKFYPPEDFTVMLDGLAE